MKKLLLLSAMLFACLFTASAQYQRRVLVEEFTNASCPPCAAQNPGFNAVLDEVKPKVTAIKYQTNWPGVDPMNAQNAAHVTARVNYYGVQGVPNAFMDGVGIANDCGYYDNAPACLTTDEIDEKYAVTSPVNIVLTHSLTADFDSIIINVSVTSDIALTGALRLHVAVIEDVINFDAAPGSNGETEFFQVMRRMLPNATGTTINSGFTAGETKTYTLAWPIGYAYDLNNLSAAAWLQHNTTKEVYNSAVSSPLSTVIVDSGTKLTNSMSPFVCTVGSSPSFTLTNSGTTDLTTAELQYRVGTGAWTNYSWTGTLAPGASEVITLTDIVLTASTKVDIRVLNSNNGTQTNLIAGLITLNINALLAPALALPYGNDFEGGAVPAGWSVSNVGSNGWKASTTVGAGGSTSSVINNFYDYAVGSTVLYTPKVDLSLATGTTSLVFDHAYTHYTEPAGSLYDTLKISVSADCGTTWTNVFTQGGVELATAPGASAAYVPTSDDEWRNNSIDLTAYNGASELLIRFVGQSGWGNNLYIDNVNVESVTASGVKTLDLNSFTLAPNPTKGSAEIRFGIPVAQSMQVMVYNSLGSLVHSNNLGEMTSGEHVVRLDAAALKLTSGSYRVVLQGKDGIAQTQMIVLN